MKKQLATIALLAVSSAAFAGQAYNLVTVPLSAQSWVKSDTALVSVAINASVKSDQLAKLHASITPDLNKIAKADWHITHFNRSQDSSGLEKVSAIAQVRLPIKDLSDLNSKVKSISKAGEMFKLADLSFTPSFKQMQKAHAHLRMDIYKQAHAEQNTLNKIFPKQHYTIYSIQFSGVSKQPRPIPMATVFVKESSNGSSQALNTSAKITTHAIVSLKAKK